MDYRVVITPPAKRRLDQYVSYTIDVLKSKQAARAILNDAREAKKELARVAGSLRLCDDEVLNQYGYRKINFSKHRYLMLYRIDGDVAIVEGIYHELQDYESIFKNEMDLQ